MALRDVRQGRQGRLVSVLKAEELLAAYEAAGPKERALARQLAAKGTRRESEVLLEILHFFPGAYLVKNAQRLPDPEDRG